MVQATLTTPDDLLKLLDAQTDGGAAGSDPAARQAQISRIHELATSTGGANSTQSLAFAKLGEAIKAAQQSNASKDLPPPRVAGAQALVKARAMAAREGGRDDDEPNADSDYASAEEGDPMDVPKRNPKVARSAGPRRPHPAWLGLAWLGCCASRLYQHQVQTNGLCRLGLAWLGLAWLGSSTPLRVLHSGPACPCSTRIGPTRTCRSLPSSTSPSSA